MKTVFYFMIKCVSLDIDERIIVFGEEDFAKNLKYFYLKSTSSCVCITVSCEGCINKIWYPGYIITKLLILPHTLLPAITTGTHLRMEELVTGATFVPSQHLSETIVFM